MSVVYLTQLHKSAVFLPEALLSTLKLFTTWKSSLWILPWCGANFHSGKIFTLQNWNSHMCVSSSLCLNWQPLWPRAQPRRKVSLLACPLAGVCMCPGAPPTQPGVTALYQVLYQWGQICYWYLKVSHKVLTEVSWIILSYTLQSSQWKNSVSWIRFLSPRLWESTVSLYPKTIQPWWNYAWPFFFLIFYFLN